MHFCYGAALSPSSQFGRLRLWDAMRPAEMAGAPRALGWKCSQFATEPGHYLSVGISESSMLRCSGVPWKPAGLGLMLGGIWSQKTCKVMRDLL